MKVKAIPLLLFAVWIMCLNVKIVGAFSGGSKVAKPIIGDWMTTMKIPAKEATTKQDSPEITTEKIHVKEAPTEQDELDEMDEMDAMHDEFND